MARLLLISAVLVLAAFLAPSVHGGGEQDLMAWVMPTAAPRCEGSMAECLDGEFDLDSESNRRILATSNYISYGALQRNTIPCSRRGASYYNCQPGAQSNPYTRGCSAITRCRG